jgi:hypothetical protein
VTSQAELKDTDIEAGSENFVSVILSAREAVPFHFEKLCQFLVRSVAFTSSVEQIRLFVNGIPLFNVHMKPIPKNSYHIPIEILTDAELQAIGIFMNISKQFKFPHNPISKANKLTLFF